MNGLLNQNQLYSNKTIEIYTKHIKKLCSGLDLPCEKRRKTNNLVMKAFWEN